MLYMRQNVPQIAKIHQNLAFLFRKIFFFYSSIILCKTRWFFSRMQFGRPHQISNFFSEIPLCTKYYFSFFLLWGVARGGTPANDYLMFTIMGLVCSDPDGQQKSWNTLQIGLSNCFLCFSLGVYQGGPPANVYLLFAIMSLVGSDLCVWQKMLEHTVLPWMCVGLAGAQQIISTCTDMFGFI